MKITAFDIFAFNLPLIQLLSVKGRPISKREGLLIRLTSEDGSVGFGEVSPLPGLSKESLKEAREQAATLRWKILNKKKFESVCHLSYLFPSVRFGLETAVLNLLAAHNLSFGGDSKNIPLIGLLQGSTKDIVSEAQRMLRQGFRNFKLKVGAKDISQDIENVQQVQAILKNRVTLRLDANQSWTFKEALYFAKAIQKYSIEYIEEPFPNISSRLVNVSEFFKETKIGVGLDESLVGMNPKDFRPWEGIKALILKPTILGGIEKTQAWIQRAKTLKIQAVISSSFESGVGLSMLAQLAVLTNSPAGLDTYKYFSKDFLKTSLKIRRGSLIVPPRTLKEKDLDFKGMSFPNVLVGNPEKLLYLDPRQKTCLPAGIRG